MRQYEELLGLAQGPLRWARSPAPRAVVEVSGPDAEGFLQRLCSQDVVALRPGSSVPAAFLDSRGKLLAIVVVGRTPSTFWLDTAAEQAAVLAELLERYHFTEQLAIRRPDGFAAGELVAEPAELGQGVGLCRELEGGGVLLTSERRGVAWACWHAPRGFFAEPPWGAAEPLDDSLGEALRLCAGLPAVGRDTDAGTLGLEADLDDHISTSKGCYTGQEIVARIHTYGHVNRRLCRLEVGSAADFEPGTPLLETAEGDPVGRAMTSAPLPDGTRRIALGYLPGDFWSSGTELRLGTPDGPPVRVL